MVAAEVEAANVMDETNNAKPDSQRREEADAAKAKAEQDAEDDALLQGENDMEVPSTHTEHNRG
jgi:hypothetical protein